MRTDTKFLRILLVLALAGVVVSGWLLSTHIRFSTGQALLTESCSFGTGQGCAAIAVSGYSFLFGLIPLAGVALGYYLAQLGLIFWALRNPQTCYEPLYTGFNLSTLAIPVTVTMAYISRVKLQSFCIGCAALWTINLLVWPLYVKQLGLNWGNALGANLETLRPKKLNLLKKRVGGSWIFAAICVAVVALVGTLAEKMQQQSSMAGETSSALQDYRAATQLFLPPEALTGDQTKEATGKPLMHIVKFSDLQCPACKFAARFLAPFLLKHRDEVSFSYRHFPLDGACNPFVPNGGHMHACAAAKASVCAGRQGKFMEFKDVVFDNQENLSVAGLRQIAQELKLDMAKWDSCLDAPATKAVLDQEMQWGSMINLESTPTILVNGRKLANGIYTPAQWEELLDALRNGSANEPAHGKAH